MRRIIPAVLVLGLVATGCGAPDGPDVATAGGARPSASAPPTAPSGDREEQVRQFAGCMREHGVDVPDPDPDGTLRLGNGGRFGNVNPSDPKVRSALTACRDKLTGLFPGRTNSPRP